MDAAGIRDLTMFYAPLDISSRTDLRRGLVAQALLYSGGHTARRVVTPGLGVTSDLLSISRTRRVRAQC